MTQREWEREVLDAIAGTAWRLYAASVSQASPSCDALLDSKDGRSKNITLSRDAFPTAEARKAELRRQLEAP